MSKDPFNFNFPFVNMMPEDIGDPNLILDSMKMMSQAWQKFATMAPQATSIAMDPNELDKRIEELKAVESWLKLNLSMLSSSIHSLEIQKANMQNFSSFMEMMSEPLKASQAAATEATQKSRAEAQAKMDEATSQETPTVPQATSTEKSTEENAGSQTKAKEPSQDEATLADTSTMMQEQALNWFNLLGDQFKNIVASVAAATPSDVVAKAEADNQSSAKKTTKTSAKKSSATKKTAAKKVASKTASKTSVKKAVKKTSNTITAKKVAAKKSTN